MPLLQNDWANKDETSITKWNKEKFYPIDTQTFSAGVSEIF